MTKLALKHDPATSRVGIVVALSGERRSLCTRRLAPGVVTSLPGNILLIQSGMGAARARAAGIELLNQGATRLISWGCAAALDGKLIAGSLLLPKTVIAADGSWLKVNRSWHTRLRHRLQPQFNVHTQALVESPGVVSTAVAKRALAERSGAIAVDMESAALAALAQEAQVPFLVIRAVADSADMAVPLALVKAMDSSAQFQLMRLLSAVVLHPTDWPTIARLAQSFRAAQKTLAGVAQYSLD